MVFIAFFMIIKCDRVSWLKQFNLKSVKILVVISLILMFLYWLYLLFVVVAVFY
jgi:hypothetical protein